MKGLCIDAKGTTLLTEGEIYDLEEPMQIFNIPVWWVPKLQYPYAKDRFILLSDIDETELTTINEKIEVA